MKWTFSIQSMTSEPPLPFNPYQCLCPMMTSSNGNISRVTVHLCGEFPTQRPINWSFDVFFDLRLNKRLSKQLWGWWFETLSRLLWRHSNVVRIKCHKNSVPGQCWANFASYAQITSAQVVSDVKGCQRPNNVVSKVFSHLCAWSLGFIVFEIGKSERRI